MSIYTRTGDQGETGVYAGKRVSKSDPQIMALGSLDELSSFIGLVMTKIKNREDKEFLALVQKDLYLMMSVLSGSQTTLTSLAKTVKQFEQKIDFIEQSLPKLKGFIIPGGNEVSAWFHVLRVICRRTERNIVQYSLSLKTENCKLKIVKYLNRLSDLLFMMARKYYEKI
ncbi:ATP:cob(I)alamin adenosyltransferase [Candidatus Roizmanbacteria bacterium CG22_combo_CG10-13_8_21_14_all_35_9]|uniref:Corrinoid adenosyltransferase n=1 Tax=Candidatus Roizmanbacteria bacterium CG22_combo_CG10-13_8_21_14_all_35_9 TaxID=1974861 RepID=A0A2H0C0L7_9BACT|nr:MAG: ATP:cob(I)alamin adenosyltransferase [Candidatus Roizmanbacteria bacterium CG22_combo_CG10-13_8_21_14_all_35_9]